MCVCGGGGGGCRGIYGGEGLWVCAGDFGVVVMG